jgi:acyl-CoA thioesterase YciA
VGRALIEDWGWLWPGITDYKNNMSPSEKPKGELVIRTIAMPADTNPNGDVFGGWLMSQMDLGSGILASKTAKARVVTVAMEGLSFLQPVGVGDTVACYAWVEKIGRTSMTIPVEVWVERFRERSTQVPSHARRLYLRCGRRRRPADSSTARWRLILRGRRVSARGNGFWSGAGGNGWLAFHLRRLNFRRRGELSLQFHPVIAGMPDVAGVGGLLTSALRQIRTAPICQCQQRNEKQRRDFFHDALASCGSDCGCGCEIG